MEICFKKGKYFKKLIEYCNPLIPVGNLKFTENGIYLNTIDTNNVALIMFHIKKEAFTKFKITKEIILTISFERLAKIFKTYKDTDIMTLKYKTDSDKLIFTFKNSSTKKTVTQRVPLLNSLDDSEMDVPDINFDSVVTISPAIISSIIKDCSTFGDKVKIQTISGDEDKIKFSVNDLEGDAEFVYEENEDDIQEIDITNEVNVIFNMKYLTKFSNFSIIAKSLKLHLSNNSPLLYEYESMIGDIKLFIAPQIEDED